MTTSWKSSVKQFCDESSLHGYHEAYYSGTVCSKFGWILIICAASVVTGYQLHNLIIDYQNNPITTKISLLPNDIKIVYPPIQVCVVHWIDWVNYTKIVELGLDVHTMLYAMSFYNYLVTMPFNTTETKINLIAFLKLHNIANMYDLAIMVSLEKLANVSLVAGGQTSINFRRYLVCENAINFPNCQLCYIADVEDDTEKMVSFKVVQFSDRSDYYIKLSKPLNYNIGNEYLNSVGKVTGDPINFPAYKCDTQGSSVLKDTDIVDKGINHKQVLNTKFYRWLPDKNNFCNQSILYNFPASCTEICVNVHKPTHFKSISNLWFVNSFEFVMGPFGPEKEEPTIDANVFYSYEQNATSDYAVKYDQYKSCLESCQNSCDQWEYDGITRHYGTSAVYLRITVNFNVMYPKRHTILATFAIPAYDWEDVTGNVGGLLGLWLGGSILSFIHVFYVFCLVPLYSCLKSSNAEPKVHSMDIRPNKL